MDFESRTLSIAVGDGFDPMSVIKAVEKAGFGATPK